MPHVVLASSCPLAQEYADYSRDIDSLSLQSDLIIVGHDSELESGEEIIEDALW